jgi:hypothetical protein
VRFWQNQRFPLLSFREETVFRNRSVAPFQFRNFESTMRGDPLLQLNSRPVSADHDDGVSDFDRMRAVFGRKGSPDVFLYVFDVLELDGRDLRA